MAKTEEHARSLKRAQYEKGGQEARLKQLEARCIEKKASYCKVQDAICEAGFGSQGSCAELKRRLIDEVEISIFNFTYQRRPIVELCIFRLEPELGTGDGHGLISPLHQTPV